MRLDHPNPLDDGAAPSWASAWGEDEQGVFLGFEVGGVEQILRWIPPDSFQMGSPDTEPGRFDWEGPRHEVSLTEGLWLADTPCTQALWMAVMGKDNNPSRFKDPRRPVERVNIQDVEAFLAAINERLPGLELQLPTEAEWEYACRAGTQTAVYPGDLAILGDNNAPDLDAIAWYRGNSGVGYDLAEFEDSSGWAEKQHKHTRAGTRRVKGKRRNPWGLYDMLGNVFEWCADGADGPPDRYPGGPRTDPLGDPGRPYRVVRGGSWRSSARLARAAYRYAGSREYRDDRVGFRVSRGRARKGPEGP